MKLKAWDKKRKRWIPPYLFALTGDGKLLIAYTTREDAMLASAHGQEVTSGWGESDVVGVSANVETLLFSERVLILLKGIVEFRKFLLTDVLIEDVEITLLET